MFVLLKFEIKLPVTRGRDGSLNLEPLVRWGRTRGDQQRAQQQGKEQCLGRERVKPKKSTCFNHNCITQNTLRAKTTPPDC